MADQKELTIEGILKHAIDIQASDIHLAEGEYMAFRVHGELEKFMHGGETSRLQPETMERLVRELFRGNEQSINDFKTRHDADFAYVAQDGTPFRVNGFYKLGHIAFVMRRIEREAKKMEDL